MGRAIQPFATEEDGDVLYAVSTDEVDNPSLTPMDLGSIASEVAWDAVLSSVPELPTPAGRTPLRITTAALQAFAGEFEFPGQGTLAVAADSGGLAATFSGIGRIYFDKGRRYSLVPIGEDLFLIDAPARDVIRFDRQAGRIMGMTLNPGPWSQRARRMK